MSNTATVSGKPVLHIDITKLSDMARLGVRRAVVFMGLGLNAAYREDFRDYELHKLPIEPGQFSLPVEFVPSGLPDEQVKKFKLEFAVWITGCGLREILEHYANFLDKIHLWALIVFKLKGKLPDKDMKKSHRNFRRLGIPEKFKVLVEQFSIKPADPRSVSQLYVARNCFTHDLGIVTQKRCDADGKLILTWTALEVFAKGEHSGTEYAITDLIGNVTQEPMNILGRYVTRQRSFLLGEKLMLTKQDLWEICSFFYVNAIPSVTKSFVEFLAANNVPVKDTEKANVTAQQPNTSSQASSSG